MIRLHDGCYLWCKKMNISNPIPNSFPTPTTYSAHPLSTTGRDFSKTMELKKISNAFSNPILQIEQGKITLSANIIMPAMFKSKHLTFLITITQVKEEQTLF